MILEFLDEDDPRVLEYFSVDVVPCLFSYYESSRFRDLDCPVIVRELVKLEEWNALLVRTDAWEYPLESCVNSNSLEMLKVLLEDGRITLKNISLGMAMYEEKLQIIELFLSNSPPNVDWDNIVRLSLLSDNRAIFNLFLIDNSGNTCDWDALFLKLIKIGDVERIRSMIEHGKVHSILFEDEPLQVAVRKNQVEVIEFLLLRSETTDQSIEIAFSRAVKSKSVEAVDILLLSGRVNKDKVRILRDDLSRTSKVVLYKTLDKYCSL